MNTTTRSTSVVQVKQLWAANRHRRWPSTLLRIWNRGQNGRDKDCIDYWIEQFRLGRHTDLHVNRHSLEVADGNHRLVAAVIVRKKVIGVIWTPK